MTSANKELQILRTKEIVKKEPNKPGSHLSGDSVPSAAKLLEINLDFCSVLWKNGQPQTRGSFTELERHIQDLTDISLDLTSCNFS